MAYVYSTEAESGAVFSVDWDAKRDTSSLFRLDPGATVATSTESYNGSVSGLSCAIARAHYLAGDRGGLSLMALQEAKYLHRLGQKAAHSLWLDAPNRTFGETAGLEARRSDRKDGSSAPGILHLDDVTGDLCRDRHPICRRGEVLGVLAEMAGPDSFLVGCGAYADMASMAARIWDTHPALEGQIPDSEATRQ